jgi:hypothetical protein
MTKIKRGQTATEYMILVAVVIVIAVVVASILGGFPGISGGTNSRVEEFKLKTSEVAVDGYANFSDHSLIKVRNNHWDTLTLQEVWVNNEPCDDERINGSNETTLNVGQTIDLNCSVTFTGVPKIRIVWKDSMGGIYTIGDTQTTPSGPVSFTLGESGMFIAATGGSSEEANGIIITMNFAVKR